MNKIYKLFSYLTENIMHLHYQQPLMILRGTTVVYCEIHMKC